MFLLLVDKVQESAIRRAIRRG